MTKIGVLLTVHNRKNKTLLSLEAIYSQSLLPNNTEIVIFVVDDNSTDGTSNAISIKYPKVKLFQGDGNLYWNGGMHLVFEKAMNESFDYYLWLNDDTYMFIDGLSKLLETSNHFKNKAIIVGSAQDPDTGKFTYGGRHFNRWRPLAFTLVEPKESPCLVETMNGNCVLIPKGIAQKIGNLDPVFTHRFGDLDYGLRARQLGIEIYIAPGFQCYCKQDLFGSWRDSSQPFHIRLKKVLDPNGFPPHETIIFAKRYGGFFWPLYWLAQYRYLFYPNKLKNFIKS